MALIDKELKVIYSRPSLILIPKGLNETTRNKYYVWRNDDGNLVVEIASTYDAYNFDGYDRENTKSEFGLEIYPDAVKGITDRPVFAVILNEKKEIIAYEVINGYDALIDDYVDVEVTSKRK